MDSGGEVDGYPAFCRILLAFAAQQFGGDDFSIR